MQKERAKVAKTNHSLTTFFSVEQRDTDKTIQSVESTDQVEQVELRPTESCATTQHGPPTVNKAKHRHGFDVSWTQNRPWLQHCVDIDSDGKKYEIMKCILCKSHQTVGRNGSSVWTTTGCRSLRLDKVHDHEKSEQHQDAVKIETKKQMNIQNAIDERTPLNEKEFEAIVCASKVVHFLVKHNIPHTTVYEDFIDFAINELKSPVLAHLSKGKNASYKSRATADELLEAMSEDIQETVKLRVKASPAYAVLTDETTDVSNKKHLAFCVKYTDAESWEVNIDYMKDVQVDDGKAETIYKETKTLIENDLDINNFAAFGSDGCNTMIGKKSGVATRLKEMKPEIIAVHCNNHRLALAAKDSFESVKQFRDVDDVLGSLHKYYKGSSNRTRSLEKLQNVLDDCETKRIKQVAHTRWLSHMDAVNSLRDPYAPVIMDLENTVESGNERVKVGSGPTATGLAKKMKTYQMIHIVHFLCDALRPLTQLALTFESNSVDLSVIKPKMDTTITTLRRLKTSDGISLRKVNKILQEFSITPTEHEIKSVKNAENQFIDNLIDNIECRLESSEVIDKHLNYKAAVRRWHGSKNCRLNIC